MLLASQDKILDIPNFPKNNNSKVINVLSDKLNLYSAHSRTQQPEAGIREHKAMQVPQDTLLENLTLANKDSSVGSAELRVPDRQLFPVHSPSVQGVSSSSVFSLAQRAACTDAVAYPCTEAAHVHTDMQASSTSNEAVLGLQHSALSCTSDSYCGQKNHRAFSAALLS